MNPRDFLRGLIGGKPPPPAEKPPEQRPKQQDPPRKYARKTYSQEGEDCILRALFLNQKTGFYVDVGAHHPFRYSNTAIFYESGWSGINIDATPGSMAPFNEFRPRDINIEAAVSDQKRRLTYHLFDEPALNTFDANYAGELLQIKGAPYKLEQTVELETATLAYLLEKHLPAGRKIDFLSVDVENHDIEVLRSNDWSRFLPDVLLVETLPGHHTELQSYVESLGYCLIANTLLTGIFAHKTSRFAQRAPG